MWTIIQLSLLSLLLGWGQISLAATKTYFVSTSGSDQNSGKSLNEAFRHPEKAFAVARDSSWYFVGYDTLEIVLAGDTVTKLGTFNLDSTLVWENQDEVRFYLHAYEDHTIHIVNAVAISSWRNSGSLLAAPWDHAWPAAVVSEQARIWIAQYPDQDFYLLRHMLSNGSEPFEFVPNVNPQSHTWETDQFVVYDDSLFVAQQTPFTALLPVLAPLLRVTESLSIRIEGIRFRGSNPGLDGGMVEIDGVDLVEINDCSFRLSNWTGLKITNVPRDPDNACCTPTGVKITNSVANLCGMSGIFAGGIIGLNIVSCETDSNGWKGLATDNLAFDNGGIILAGVEGGSVTDHTSNRNDTRGMWIYGSKNVSITNSELAANKYDGITLSSNPSAVQIHGCDVKDNAVPSVLASSSFKAAGIRNNASQVMGIDDCVVSGNDVQFMLGLDTAPCTYGSAEVPSCESQIVNPIYLSADGINDFISNSTLETKTGNSEIWGYDDTFITSESWEEYFENLTQWNVEIITAP